MEAKTHRRCCVSHCSGNNFRQFTCIQLFISPKVDSIWTMQDAEFSIPQNCIATNQYKGCSFSSLESKLPDVNRQNTPTIDATFILSSCLVNSRCDCLREKIWQSRVSWQLKSGDMFVLHNLVPRWRLYCSLQFLKRCASHSVIRIIFHFPNCCYSILSSWNFLKNGCIIFFSTTYWRNQISSA